MRWEALRDKVAKRVTDANEVARSYVQDATPGIYSLNRNYAAYTIEQVNPQADFILWDEQTVKRLIVEQPDVMPYYSPTKALNRGIDIAYGKKQITKSVTSSILMGRSIKHIADDLQQRIVGMSRDSAIRTARTAVTGAQNAGRMDSYAAAEKMGIKVEKEWVATKDSRTRHSHAMVDGEIKEYLKEKFSNGCLFPGDPNGPPGEIYNCRCTLVNSADRHLEAEPHMMRVKNPETGEYELVEKKTYAEWAGWKKSAHLQIGRQNDNNDNENSEILKSSDEYYTIQFKKLSESIGKWGIEYNPVKPLEKELTHDEIVSKVSGGDMTKGSCSSAAFAYIGNKNGLDVLDFRGGDSQSTFSRRSTIEAIANIDGVVSKIIKNNNSITAAVEAIKTVEQNKTYYLSAGQHAAIIRKSPNGIGYQYLELQSPEKDKNCFKPLTNNALKSRWGCKKTHSIGGIKVEQEAILIETESLKGNNEFEKILGYINTDSSNQKKGAGGSAK